MLLTVSLKKKQIVVAVGLAYGLASVQAAEPVITSPLYIERGNIQVSKTVKTNPMGGTSIEYAKTRLNNLASQTDAVKVVNAKPTQSVMEQNKKRRETEVKEPASDAPLFVEKGNIEVRKMVKTNPMGGTTIEYVKTRNSDLMANQEAPLESVAITEEPAIAENAVSENERLDMGQTAELEAKPLEVKPIAQKEPVVMPNVMPVFPQAHQEHVVVDAPKLMVKSTNMTGKEKALLAQIKAKKLMLSPDEVHVGMPKRIKPKRVKKKRHQAEDAIISKLEFTRANMRDVARALADISGLNFVATEKASKKNVTVFLQNISVKNALEAITKNSGLWYRKDKESGTYRIMSTKEYQQDLVVYREDTTRVFDLLHPNPLVIATTIRDLYGNRVVLSMGVQDTFGTMGGGQQGGGVSAGRRSGQVRNTGSGNRRSVRNNRGQNRQTFFGGGNRGGNVGNNNDILQDELTVGQLQKLEGTIAKKGEGALDADDLKGINNQQQPIFVTLNQEHDLMIVRTSDSSVMRDIEQLVKELDRPVKQVLLEMKILSLEVGDAYRQSMDLDYMPSRETLRGPATFQDKNPLGEFAQEDVTTTRSIDDGNGNTLTATSNGVNRFGVRNILGLGNYALEGGTFVYQFLSNKIRARIQLMQENNRVNTLSSPVLLTSNNKPASLFVGTEQVVTTGFDAAGGGSNGLVAAVPIIVPITELRNIGNTLQVMPKINSDKSVTLIIQQDSSTLVRGASTIPIPVGGIIQSFNVDSVKTSNIQGTVQAKDGLTIAIGGLIDSSESEVEQKVPILGDFPILGELFKRKVQQKSKRELLLLITPHIIESPNDAEDLTRDAVEPLSDQDW